MVIIERESKREKIKLKPWIKHFVAVFTPFRSKLRNKWLLLFLQNYFVALVAIHPFLTSFLFNIVILIQLVSVWEIWSQNGNWSLEHVEDSTLQKTLTKL